MWHLLAGRTVEFDLKLTDNEDGHCTTVRFMLWDREAAGGQPNITVSARQLAIPEDKSQPDWDSPDESIGFTLEYTDIKMLAGFLRAATELIEKAPPPSE